MERKIILENLAKLRYLKAAERNKIADEMAASWEEITKKWGDPYTFEGLAEDKYKEKIKDLSKYFALYLTANVKQKTVEKIYNKLFGHIEASDHPLLIIVAGAIASGKSTVVECVIPEKYGKNYGLVDKDKIKASNIFRDIIHAKFGDEHGNLVEDFMLGLRDDIGKKAIENKKGILLEQSCKTKGFLETCKLAKEYGFKIYAEIVITPIAFTCVRNIYRYVTGLMEDPTSARYEAYVNIKDTYDNAPKVLDELQKDYADEISVYTSDILKVETGSKTMSEIFDEVTNGRVSDISVEIARRIYEHIKVHIDLVKDNQDVMDSLSITERKLSELASNPDMIEIALPQAWQPQSVRRMLNKLNAPLEFSYSKRLKQNSKK